MSLWSWIAKKYRDWYNADQPIYVIHSAEYVPYDGKPRPTREQVREDVTRLLNAAFPPEQEQALKDWQMRQIEILNEEEEDGGK